jgi:tRNA dimethylallyltransferase
VVKKPNSMDKYLVVICGPTAIGKTEIAIDIAKPFKTEIISADARQFYIEMNIGTAKPSIQQLEKVKHHFINSLSITEDYNAGQFEMDALKVLKDLFQHHNLAVMVGGSGFYINTVCYGIDDLPSSDAIIRKDLIHEFESNGLPLLLQELKQADSVYYNEVDLANPHRIIRALEVYRITGMPYSSFLNKPKKERPFKVIKIGLDIDRKELYNRINKRVDSMIEAGLEREVKSLLSFRNTNALNTVGYSEWFNYFEGKIPLERVIELIKQNSRHYAKRQLTWFGRATEIKWFKPEQTEDILDYLKRIIK